MKPLLKLLLLLSLVSCKKDPPESIPQEPPIIKVPVYQPCDTTFGRAEAVKQSTLWLGGITMWPSSYQGEKFWSFGISTCSANMETREFLNLGGVPDQTPMGSYSIVHPTSSGLQNQSVASSFATLLSDGDVVEDIYRPDTTAENYFIIDKWDLSARRAEGRFSITYKISGGKSNPGNPDNFILRNGKFWARIPD